MERAFEREGTLLDVAGNRPLLLNDGESVWLVRSGGVDIFAVEVEGKEVVGARVHLWRAEVGHVFFGMDTGKYGRSLHLIAVGAPNTRVLQLELSRIKEHAADPRNAESLDGLISSWVTGLSVAVRKEGLPRAWVELKAGEDVGLKEGRSARPEVGVIWVRHMEGDTRFMGRSDLSSLDGHEEVFVPLSNQAWLLATSDSKLRCGDTWSTLRDDRQWSGLERFHGLILECVALNKERTEAEEAQRLRIKDARDRLDFENALIGLGGVMDTGDPVAASGCDDTDALGLVCRMIGKRLGIEIETPTPEARAGRGPLDAIARASRIRTRRVLLTDGWYRRDHGPLLGFLREGNRPVALLPTSARGYSLHDPAAGAQGNVTPETADDLAAFAYTFYRPFPRRALSALDLFKFGLHGSSGDVGMVFAVAIVGAILGLVTPLATGIIISKVIPGSEVGYLGQITLIVVTCALASCMFELTKSVALVRMESKMDAFIQAGVMDRLLSLPVPFFRTFTTGDLTNRALGINEMRQIACGVTMRAILGGVFSSFNCVLLFYYDAGSAMIAVVLVLAGIGITRGAGYRSIQYQRDSTRIEGRIAGLLLQLATGITRLRVSGTEDRAFSIWAKEFTEQKTILGKANRIRDMLTTFNSAFPILLLMAIFAWVAMGSEKLMSAGDFAAFNAAYVNFQNALFQMSMALMASLRIIPLYERLKPILHTMPETDVGKVAPGELAGEIEINHISFRYDPDGPLVLEDVSLLIRPGEFVALVGSSGSGKSTLFRLLLGFENQESGTIYYDGQDLSSLDIREVRRQMGVVLQNGKVMTGSVFRNIVGSSGLTMEDAWEAARMAGFDEDIRQMPMGMHTEMSAGGATLSGGQRQRLLIARALVHKPRILFFDEATSALDNLTQEIVGRSLEKLQATRVLIAHRLSTILAADRIYVLDRGRIVQSGTYEELMSQEGLFAELAERQIA